MHRHPWATITRALTVIVLAALSACADPAITLSTPTAPIATATPTQPRPPTSTATRAPITLTVSGATTTPTAMAMATATSRPTQEATATPLPTQAEPPTATQPATATPGEANESSGSCSNRADNYQAQMDEWLAQVQQEGLPSIVMQVDLEGHPKVSQYLPKVTSAYGFNACGLVAAAAALAKESWLPLAAEIRTAGGDAYGPGSGIQPSPYANALRQVFGAEAVAEENEWTLCVLHQALHEGAVVIVDIQVGSTLNERREQPTTQAPDYAHFARVLGVDLEAEMIYVENTLGGEAAYWPLTLPTFWEVWKHPETAVSVRAPNPEDVPRWAVIIQPQGASIAGERNGGKPYG